MESIWYIMSLLCIAGAFLPFNPSDHWIVRGQDNLKVFYLFIALILFVTGFLFVSFSLYKWIVLFSLLISILTCLYFVIPFTRLYPKVDVKAVKDIHLENQFSFLIFNVYQENDQYHKLIHKVKTLNPDIILLLETSSDWDQALHKLKGKYPFEVKEIREDTYGIICLSKVPFIKSQVNHWVLENVPSLEIVIHISNKAIRIFGLHPKPPVPNEKTYSTSKDKEIMRTGNYINTLSKNEAKLLIGDLNEVAWCRTSTAFKKTTGMKDLRIGRGYYGTFPTYSPIRFPLDHIYCSSHFELVNFKTIDNLGSDHLGVYAKLQLKE